MPPPAKASRLGFVFGARRREIRARQARFPDEPWRWRPEWESGVVRASCLVPLLVTWLVGPLFLGMGVATVVAVRGELANGTDPFVWLFLALPLIGLAVSCRAVLLTARVVRYGRPVLRLAATPCVLGGQVQGTIEFPGGRLPPAEDAELELQERHLVVRSSDDGAESARWVVWSHQFPLVLRGGESTVPVSLPIPSNAQGIDPADLSRIDWRVRLRVATSGPAVDVVFGIPVFAGPGGDDRQTKETIEAATARAAAARGEKTLVHALAREGLSLRRHPDGLELRVPPVGWRRFGFAATAFLLTLVPIIVWWVAVQPHPSFWRWVTLAPFAVLAGVADARILTKSFRIRAGDHGLRVVRRILGVTSVWQIPYKNITAIRPRSSMPASSVKGPTDYYDLVIYWHTDPQHRIVRLGLGIGGKTLATVLGQALRESHPTEF